MQMEERHADAVLVVKLVVARLDASAAVAFRERLTQRVAEGSSRIVINLEAVTFIDSSGLGAMVSVLKALGRDGKMRLCGVQSSVATLFKLTRMDTVFGVAPSEEEAIRSLAT